MTHYDDQYEEEYNTRQEAFNKEWEDYVANVEIERAMERHEPPTPVDSKYSRPLPSNLTNIDVYDVLKLFEVNDPAIQHAIKKLLCTGMRGHKSYQEDLQEALFSVERALQLNEY